MFHAETQRSAETRRKPRKTRELNLSVLFSSLRLCAPLRLCVKLLIATPPHPYRQGLTTSEVLCAVGAGTETGVRDSNVGGTPGHILSQQPVFEDQVIHERCADDDGVVREPAGQPGVATDARQHATAQAVQ